MKIGGKFINFVEIGGKFINFVETEGICYMHHWLRGMDVSEFNNNSILPVSNV